MGSLAISDAGRALSFDPAAVAWRVLDEVVLVYSDRSGATHQFGEFDGWVVRQIADGPVTLEALTENAAALVDLTPVQLAARLREVVQALDALALLTAPA